MMRLRRLRLLFLPGDNPARHSPASVVVAAAAAAAVRLNVGVFRHAFRHLCRHVIVIGRDIVQVQVGRSGVADSSEARFGIGSRIVCGRRVLGG